MTTTTKYLFLKHAVWTLSALTLVSCGKKPLDPERKTFTKSETDLGQANFVDPDPEIVPSACTYWQSKEVANPMGDYRFAEDLKFGKDGLYGRFSLKDNIVLRYGASDSLLNDETKFPIRLREFKKKVKDGIDVIPWWQRLLVGFSDDWKANFGKLSYGEAQDKLKDSIKQLEALEIYYKANPDGIKPPKRGDLDWLIAMRLKKFPVGFDEVLPGTFGDVAGNLDKIVDGARETHPLIKLFQKQTGITIDSKNFMVVQKYLQQRSNLFAFGPEGTQDWLTRQKDIKMSLAVLRESAEAKSVSELQDGALESKVCRFMVAQRVTAQLLTLKGIVGLKLDAKGKAVTDFVVLDGKIGDKITYRSVNVPSAYAIGDSPELIDKDWIINNRFLTDDAHAKGGKGPDVRPQFGENATGFMASMGFWITIAAARDDRIFETPGVSVAAGPGDNVRLPSNLLELAVGMFSISANTFADHIIKPDSVNVRLNLVNADDDIANNLVWVGAVAESAQKAFAPLADPSPFDQAVFSDDTLLSLYEGSKKMGSLFNLVIFEGLQRLQEGRGSESLVKYFHEVGNRLRNKKLLEAHL